MVWEKMGLFIIQWNIFFHRKLFATGGGFLIYIFYIFRFICCLTKKSKSHLLVIPFLEDYFLNCCWEEKRIPKDSVLLFVILFKREIVVVIFCQFFFVFSFKNQFSWLVKFWFGEFNKFYVVVHFVNFNLFFLLKLISVRIS